jgi:hypothetical protein
VRIAARRVAFSRTFPEPPGAAAPVHEIRQLYLDAVASANELIYLENQYFSSEAVYQALLDRFAAADRPRLEVVLILPKRAHSWVEATTLDPPKLRMLEHLRAAAREHGHRLGVYYPTAVGDDGREVPIVLHSKVLSVDDRFLTVGSANTSNRSMGLDTELNLSWEVLGPDDEALGRSIRRARVSLLAEHCGLLRHPDARRILRRRQGLIEYLDGLADARGHRLRHLTSEAMIEDQEWIGHLARWGFGLDPGSPLLGEQAFERLEPSSDSFLARGVVWLRDRIGKPHTEV